MKTNSTMGQMDFRQKCVSSTANQYVRALFPGPRYTTPVQCHTKNVTLFPSFVSYTEPPPHGFNDIDDRFFVAAAVRRAIYFYSCVSLLSFGILRIVLNVKHMYDDKRPR